MQGRLHPIHFAISRNRHPATAGLDHQLVGEEGIEIAVLAQSAEEGPQGQADQSEA